MRHLVVLLAVGLASGCGGPGWVERHGRDDPDLGAIVEVGTGARLGEAALLDRLRAADFVLLGEKHDNADHHALQAHVTRELGPKLSAVVFEQMTTDQQGTIVDYVRAHPDDAAGLGAALDWQTSGWPDWALYAPIADAALDDGAEIVAGNLPGAEVNGVVGRGLDGLSPALVRRSGLDAPLAPDLQADLMNELFDSHCGYAPMESLGNMALVQRARDARMADRLAKVVGKGLAVLIAGTGHVRVDRGVPLYLARLAPSRTALSLAFVEVQDGIEGEIAAMPYDYVWLTPGHDTPDHDPCEGLKEQFEGTAIEKVSATP